MRLPTLLVGLGGTGCRIVDQVLGRARVAGMDRDRDQRIEFIGFDTDVVDIKRLKNLSNNVFQVSDNKTVYEVASKYDGGIDWMVSKDRLHELVRTQPLDKGAGQLRILTRLALFDRFSDYGFEPRVRAALTNLTRHDGREAFKGTINVFVVGSLAGGTASGSFLPIALLLNDLLREMGSNPTVNGLFLLGDIFINTGKLPVKQLPNVRANTYAALAELHAVNSAVGSEGDINGLKYEYLPGRYPIRDGRPFHDVTLIDFENQTGGNLGREIDYYERLAARALFTLIFTAIGGARTSIDVNNLLDKTSPRFRHDVRFDIIERAGTDLTKYVSSAGVYAIEYPREDVLKYLSTCFARNMLSREWLLLDERFRDRVKRYNEERKTNFKAKEPVKDIAFMEDFRQSAQEGNQFFAELLLNLEPEADLETGLRRKPQVHAFVDAFESRMVDAFWDAAPELRAIKNQRQELAAENLGDAASAIETVQNFEGRLEIDWRTLVDAMGGGPDAQFNIILSNTLTARPGEWRPYHIQSYVLADDPHLVQVRYFLYAARSEIAKRAADKKVDTDRIREELFGLATAWDPDRDPKTATERGARAKLIAAVRTAGKGSFMGLGRASEFKKFQQNFAGYYNDSIEKMREWAEASVKRRAYVRLKNELDMMVRVVEGMFTEVGRIADRLSREEKDALQEHDPLRNAARTGTLFVCADPACKEALWRELSFLLAGRGIGKEANRSLATAFLSAYAEMRKDDHGQVPAFDEMLHETIVEKFAKNLIKSEEYRKIYDMGLADALGREAAVRHTPWLALLQSLVRRTRDFARPFLPLAPDDAGQPMTFWAMNLKLFERFASSSDFESTFADEQGVRTLVEDEFPDTELLCYAMRGNLALDEIAKINPGPKGEAAAGDIREGPYHAAYRERVETILDFEFSRPRGVFEGATMTPHVTKDWHKPGRLVPIFDALRIEQEQRLNNAYVTAQCVPGLLDRLTLAGLGNVSYLDLSRLVAQPGDRYELVRSHDDWAIYQALSNMAQLIGPILIAWTEWLSGYSGAAEESPVANAEITERLLTLALNQIEAQSRRRAVPGLLRAQFALIRGVVDQRNSAQAYHARVQRQVDIVKALGETTFGRLAQVSPDILGDIRATYNREVARIR